MTPTRFRECLAALALTQRGLAPYLSCSARTPRHWAAGSHPIPEKVAVRRSYGHHRDLPAGGSGTRTTTVVPVHQHDGVMIQHDEPQSSVAAACSGHRSVMHLLQSPLP